MTSGYDVYRRYLAVKTHFVSDRYDFIDAGGRTVASHDSYERRRDRYYFEKLGRKLAPHEVVPFFVANFLQSFDAWVGEMTEGGTDLGFDTFYAWERRVKALKKTISDDIDNCRAVPDFTWTRVIECTTSYPLVFVWLRREMISPETAIFLDKIFGWIQSGDEVFDDLVWKTTTRKLHKYSRFLQHIKWNSLRSLVPEVLTIDG